MARQESGLAIPAPAPAMLRPGALPDSLERSRQRSRPPGSRPQRPHFLRPVQPKLRPTGVAKRCRQPCPAGRLVISRGDPAVDGPPPRPERLAAGRWRSVGRERLGPVQFGAARCAAAHPPVWVGDLGQSEVGTLQPIGGDRTALAAPLEWLLTPMRFKGWWATEPHQLRRCLLTCSVFPPRPPSFQCPRASCAALRPDRGAACLSAGGGQERTQAEPDNRWCWRRGMAEAVAPL